MSDWQENYIIVYVSCYGTIEQTECLTRKVSNSVLYYLKRHETAYPLYRIRVRLK